MFWGLVLEPSKRYTQKVEQSFHISQASLDLNSADNEPIQLILEVESSNFVLANLSKKHNVFQVPLDLNFRCGDQISFRTFGKGRVHLTGYHVPEEEFEGLMNLDDEDSDLEDELTEGDSPQPPGKRKKGQIEQAGAQRLKKLKMQDSESEDSDDELDSSTGMTTLGESTLAELDDLDDSDSEDDDDEDDDSDDESDDDDESDEMETPQPKKKGKNEQQTPILNGTSSGKKKGKLDTSTTSQKGTPKQGKTPKQEGKSPKTPRTPKTEGKSPKTPRTEGKSPKAEGSPGKKVLEGGVVVEEMRGGQGAPAKPGRMAQVYYVGRLQSNNKQFDSTTQGPGFKFRIGRGEVIKGWDIGVSGMKVGGKRRITIPPALAYGARGSPPVIPPNAALVFEVELKGLS